MISYAQNYEDVILNRAFGGKPRGFYIDVGAWDPTVDSVTKHFYDLGWSGINVEPAAEPFRALQTERPRDLNLQVALGDCRAMGNFYEVADSGSLDVSPRSPYRSSEVWLRLRCSICRGDDPQTPMSNPRRWHRGFHEDRRRGLEGSRDPRGGLAIVQACRTGHRGGPGLSWIVLHNRFSRPRQSPVNQLSSETASRKCSWVKDTNCATSTD